MFLLSDSNVIQTQNYLVLRRTRNHLFGHLYGWMFVYELSGCGFESRCSQFNFRYCVCFEATIACRFDLKRVPDMIIIYSHFFYRLCYYQANKRLFHRSFWSIKTNCKIIVFQVKLPVLFLYLQKYWGIWRNRKRLENNVEQQCFE